MSFTHWSELGFLSSLKATDITQLIPLLTLDSQDHHVSRLHHDDSKTRAMTSLCHEQTTAYISLSLLRGTSLPCMYSTSLLRDK